ncbi:MAG: hypothetical protein IPM98_21820 [Lewinellaceae bacterium]|nr:hypothetical protein [Lewinellaceae bacterium]
MKLIILASLLSIAALFSCNKVVGNPTPIPDASLESRLHADPEVHAARKLLKEYGRTLVSLQPEVLLDVLAKLESCGLHHATANLPELEKCLEGNPAQKPYIRCVQLLRLFEKSVRTVEQRYPELAERNSDEKNRMVLLLEEESVLPVIGSVQKNRAITDMIPNTQQVAQISKKD